MDSAYSINVIHSCIEISEGLTASFPFFASEKMKLIPFPPATKPFDDEATSKYNSNSQQYFLVTGKFTCVTP